MDDDSCVRFRPSLGPIVNPIAARGINYFIRDVGSCNVIEISPTSKVIYRFSFTVHLTFSWYDRSHDITESPLFLKIVASFRGKRELLILIEENFYRLVLDATYGNNFTSSSRYSVYF